MKTKPFILTSIFGTVILLAAAGSGLYITEMNKKNLANTEKIAVEKTALDDELPNDLLTVDEIKSLAKAEAPQATVSAVALEKSKDTYQYKTKLSNGLVIYFNARTGKQISTSRDNVKPPPVSIPDTSISFNNAKKIALAHNPTGKVTRIDLEDDKGTLNYCVWFGDAEHIDVRAKDGVVTHVDLKRAEAAKPQPKPSTPPTKTPIIDRLNNAVRDNPVIKLTL